MIQIWRQAHQFIHILLVAIACLNLNPFTSFAQVIKSTFKHPSYLEPNIFVITNRQADTSTVKFSFTNHVKTDPSLTFFRVNASSTDSLLLNRLDSTAFLGEISKIRKQDWLLYVHGDSKTFEEAVIRGLNIQNTHKVRVIVFAWPSKDVNLHGFKNFKTSYQNVEKSVSHFNAVLRTMIEFRNCHPGFLSENHLSLFLHSLGNSYLERSVKQNLLLEVPPVLFDNVIINAAAVEQKNHARWVEQLQFQKYIFITCNNRDINLNGLRIFTSQGKQLGQKATSAFANNAFYFDFTESVGFRIPTPYTHSYFIGKVPKRNKNICLFYAEIFHGQLPDLSDESRFVKRGKSSNDIIVW